MSSGGNRIGAAISQPARSSARLAAAAAAIADSGSTTIAVAIAQPGRRPFT